MELTCWTWIRKGGGFTRVPISVADFERDYSRVLKGRTIADALPADLRRAHDAGVPLSVTYYPSAPNGVFNMPEHLQVEAGPTAEPYRDRISVPLGSVGIWPGATNKAG